MNLVGILFFDKILHLDIDHERLQRRVNGLPAVRTVLVCDQDTSQAVLTESMPTAGSHWLVKDVDADRASELWVE